MQGLNSPGYTPPGPSRRRSTGSRYLKWRPSSVTSACGNIEWVDDQNFGIKVPKTVEGVDMKRLDPKTYYTAEQIADMVSTLNKERVEHLAKYPGLNKGITDSIL